MSTSPVVTPNASEPVRDPRIDAWNEGPSPAPQALAPALTDPAAMLDDLALPKGSALGATAAVAALEKVGVASVEQLLGLAAPMMVLLGLYSMLSGAYEVVATFNKGDVTDAMYRFGLVGQISPQLFKLIMGVCLITFAQLSTRRRWVSFALMGLFGLASVVILILCPLFLLDAIQARPNLPPQLAGKILLASAVFVSAFLAGASAAFGGCAWTLGKHAAFLATDKKTIAKAWDK